MDKPDRSATQAVSSPRLRWQLWIVTIGFFMQTLDTTIVNTALPAMAHSLQQNPLHMHSVIVAYVLTVAVTLPLSGWLADRFGVRNVFFSAIVLFSVGSLFCAAATTLHQLLLARVIQGIGGAMMVPVGRLTVMKLVPREQYMSAMTLVTLPGQIGPLLGPALGGLLVEYASWHWIFLINLPVGLIGAVATLWLLPNISLPPGRFDFKGFFLLALAMATLTLALDAHQQAAVNSLWVSVQVMVGVSAVLLYLWHARGNDNALFSLKLFKQPIFSIGLAGSFSGRIGSAMLPFMAPLFLQIAMGFTPFHAGLMMIPMVLGNMSIKRLVVQLVNYFGYRNTLTGSTLALALVVLMFPVSALLHLPWLLPPVLFLQGMINGVRFSAMNTLTLKELPEQLASSGNSMMSMSQQLTMSIGVTIAGIILGAFAHQTLAGPADIHLAFIKSWFCIALIIALPALIFLRVPKNVSKNTVLVQHKRGK
ncbi:multidrug transporter subunit MdtD [Erwinia sp. OLTSP20]|uniref:multidrug transporter subunit MdtD n=1 Tax=unclassified Erwinia TaxID=2622719 RepID=UPI000C1A034B|nr:MULTISPECIES: multidrug transporter subunit MdtD [unclassified Erwinia]PIJ50553.1 multidrug transporter subunit MdtD [Erwinia sp. OAMSP11]PIJ72872.1 multidrug transporter subunit MdtD [Erwinia sp. OLSSP12]PIJ82201.1 multidrug transporter subunit MdtD [Erwinia sp. OLCASP19]PIJ84755.1 multidrug transporter subunit MdtD [Erwinia sp. OLMTSP26]PIJ86719.1 multidrug transporter subunit MdtD [Erwinia sp. OLMDSP33]